MRRKYAAATATAGVTAGVLGLTALSLPAGAGPDPALPPIAAEQLVESVMTAEEPAMAGTVQVDNELGLPAIPGAGQSSDLLSDGTNSFQVWSDGQGRHRLSVPSSGGEMTVVDDGKSLWKWDSAQRKTVRTSEREHREHGAPNAPADPAKAARQVVGQLQRTSTVAVDGTANVAGRDAYELVLTPKPTERTVLREVRIAVDAEKRIPLEVAVHTHGSENPALRVGFSDLNMTEQDPGLFRFSPPKGTEVTEPRQEQRQQRDHGLRPEVVGDGWDTVIINQLPEQTGNGQTGNADGQDPTAMAKQVGKRISGPWGDGWIVGTKAGSALLTSDGRVALGAVPEQVLTAAVGNAR